MLEYIVAEGELQVNDFVLLPFNEIGIIKEIGGVTKFDWFPYKVQIIHHTISDQTDKLVEFKKEQGLQRLVIK